MTKIYNKRAYTPLRGALRRSMSKAEVLLWKRLSRKQLLGFKFRRQYGVDQYVIDFYCPKLKLAIEVDGPTHYAPGAEVYDKQRQEHMEALGIIFLRFTNTDIYENLNEVLQSIADKTDELSMWFAFLCLRAVDRERRPRQDCKHHQAEAGLGAATSPSLVDGRGAG